MLCVYNGRQRYCIDGTVGTSTSQVVYFTRSLPDLPYPNSHCRYPHIYTFLHFCFRFSVPGFLSHRLPRDVCLILLTFVSFPQKMTWRYGSHRQRELRAAPIESIQGRCPDVGCAMHRTHVILIRSAVRWPGIPKKYGSNFVHGIQNSS